MTRRVLVADDDPDIRVLVATTLRMEGFEVLEAADGAEAVEQALRERPDILVLDVMMPRVDGFEALQQLRNDGRISHLPVILVTSRSQPADLLDGFDAGADDYMTKPFQPAELVARVTATLRRMSEMRDLQPLTGLPGNAAIDREVARRVELGRSFALLVADLDNFKAFNDHYGFSRGDDVLATFADLLTEAADAHGAAETFVGHVGGDDFVVLAGLDEWDPISQQVCDRFDAVVPSLYDEEDRERGHIVVPDRRGVSRTFPLVTVSIGVTLFDPEEPRHPEELVSRAAEMKAFAKARNEDGSSSVAVDRRRGSSPSTG